MQPAKLSYKIYQGSTFQEAYRWESQTKVYVPIQSINKAAPCVITTTVPHELPIGWRFRVVGAGGMKEINSTADSYLLATGNDEAYSPTLIDVQDLQDTYNGLLDTWNDMKAQDAQSVAPTIRPWANMTTVATYQYIMSNTQISPPVPSNFPVALNNLNNSYTTWQNAITANAATVAAALAAQANKIEINQVNSLQYTTYTNGGTVEYNKPVDLTGYKARMQIRKTATSSEVIYEASSDTGEIEIDLTYSSITITIPASVTQNFNFTAAVYSVELYTTAGKVVPFLTGNLTLVQEITR